MSCVVGIIDGKHIWMGADSFISDGEEADECKESKVFKLGNRFIIGCVGSLRYVQIMKHLLSPPNHPSDVSIEKYITDRFVSRMMTAFLARGHIINREGMCEGHGQSLIGYRGRLFQIDNNFAAMENKRTYNAVGAGAPYALGVLSVTEGDPPEERIKKAIKAAHIASSVGGETVIIKL